MSDVVNVASVPHRSPFRYPGGKTWLVPLVRRWLTSLPIRPALFCEPFCGGAIVGLSALFEERTDGLLLVELDEDVAAVWNTVLNGQGDKLIAKIGAFEITKDTVAEAVQQTHEGTFERAFATIVRNRVQRGGILASGASLMKAGENGRGLGSRWYAKTLQTRIRDIRRVRERISFLHGDGLVYLREYQDWEDAVFFIDPPYTVAGRRLYTHSEIDHGELFRIASGLRGDFLMTYDDAEPVRRLAARFGLDTHTVPMKNTHHAVKEELLVGRDLRWARTQPRQLGADALLEGGQRNGSSGNQALD